jgi:tRNA U34 5-carboxymethylaminomethyl modifying GTPase MnmE/TrmE
LVEIEDTAGAGGYQDSRQRWIEESDMILVVVDGSLPNLEEADRILKSLRGLRPAILVRNQFDVKSKDDSSSSDLASKHGCEYFELSARDGEQVRKLFIKALRLTQPQGVRTVINSDPKATPHPDPNSIHVETTIEVEKTGARGVTARKCPMRDFRRPLGWLAGLVNHCWCSRPGRNASGQIMICTGRR